MPLALQKLKEFLADQKEKLTAQAMSSKALRGILEQDREHVESLERLYHGRINGSLAEWRASHPDAQVANIEGRTDLTSADFVHLRRINRLNMRGCNQRALDDAAFAHLAGIQVLDMSGCNQSAITDAAFRHLEGIQTLTMSCCNQSTITDAAFEGLEGLQDLTMEHCDQDTITGRTLLDLGLNHGLSKLNIFGCPQLLAHYYARAAREALARAGCTVNVRSVNPTAEWGARRELAERLGHSYRSSVNSPARGAFMVPSRAEHGAAAPRGRSLERAGGGGEGRSASMMRCANYIEEAPIVFGMGDDP